MTPLLAHHEVTGQLGAWLVGSGLSLGVLLRLVRDRLPARQGHGRTPRPTANAATDDPATTHDNRSPA